jgi:hypothetical protein
MRKVAEIWINGPKGMARYTVPVEDDGKILEYQADAALTMALIAYNDLPQPKERNDGGNDIDRIV